MNNEFNVERNKGYINYKIGNEYKPKTGNSKYILEYEQCDKKRTALIKKLIKQKR